MKLQYLRAFIVLVAGLITLLINMKTGRPVTQSLLIVLIVIIIFYVIGTLVVEILQQGLENDDSTSESETSENDEQNDENEKEEPIAFSFDDDDVD